MKRIWNKFKATKGYRISKIIMDSASFALFLSVAFFAYEISEGKRETDEVVKNLVSIQNSLSTRYLGLFPEYIYNINTVLEKALEHQKASSKSDTVIIFEDVLYYGIRSDAEGFRKMYQNILQLAENGCHITIAHYDIKGRPFNQMVKDGLIDIQYQRKHQLYVKNHFDKLRTFNKEREKIPYAPNSIEYQDSMLELVAKYFPDIYNPETKYITKEQERKHFARVLSNYNYIDSIASERYFDSTKVNQKQKIQKMIKGYNASIPLEKGTSDSISIIVNQMCQDLEIVMRSHMDKSVKNITYADFEHMYSDMTTTITKVLKTNANIELVPLNETLLMSCWLTKIGDEEQAIFAFPSKYSTDEIGFISQDEAFARYIHTMLNGIKNNTMHLTE